MTKIEISNFVVGVRGWLHWEEGELLYDLAKETPKNTIIVEIGPYMGRSTCWLLGGSTVGNGNRVYTIDPHTGNPGEFEGNSYNIFKENIQKLGLWDMVNSLVMTSEEAAPIVNEPVSLLFIDGNHEYEYVLKDYSLWFPKMVVGGIIAFHDVRNYRVGIMKVIKDNIRNNEEWEILGQVCSILYAKKQEKEEK